MVNKMLDSILSYKVTKDFGRYTEVLREVDTLENAIETAREEYRASKKHRIIVEGWEYYYDENEDFIDCEFYGIFWDSDTIPPWIE